MHSLLRLAVAAMVAVLSVAALGACSSDDASDRSTDSQVSIDPPTTAPIESIVPPTSATDGSTSETGAPGETGETGDDNDDQTSSTTAGNLEVVRFELPARVPCIDGTATAIASYETTGAETVAFLVDQASVAGGPNPPVSGRHVLDLTCGATHTVVLVAVGGGGQVLASRAVTADVPAGAPQG
jgi:hypothetical protein